MPQITFDITDAQQKQVDDLNAARNAKLAAGATPSSRQTFAAEAFGVALRSAAAAEVRFAPTMPRVKVEVKTTEAKKD